MEQRRGGEEGQADKVRQISHLWRGRWRAANVQGGVGEVAGPGVGSRGQGDSRSKAGGLPIPTPRKQEEKVVVAQAKGGEGEGEAKNLIMALQGSLFVGEQRQRGAFRYGARGRPSKRWGGLRPSKLGGAGRNTRVQYAHTRAHTHTHEKEVVVEEIDVVEVIKSAAYACRRGGRRACASGGKPGCSVRRILGALLFVCAWGKGMVVARQKKQRGRMWWKRGECRPSGSSVRRRGGK